MTDLTFTATADDRPVFFVHKNKKEAKSVSIEKYFKTPDELAEWEQLMRDEVGLVIDAQQIIAGGGCCCGGGGGMCDVD